MAYNRAFNPDALPAFAEPERRPVPAPAASSSATSSNPPRTSSQASHQYKPAPPLPHQNSNNAHTRPSTSSHASNPHLQPIQANHRQDSYGQPSTQIGRFGTPVGSLGQPHGPRGRDYALASPPGTSDGRVPVGGGGGGGGLVQGSGRPQLSPSSSIAGGDPNLLPLFRAVDKNGSGQLSERELGAALVNGDWSPFDPHTIRLMIRMFDSDRSGFIGFSEFCGLWSFLASWRTLFDRFDVDKSGNISLDEFKAALDAFGYRLSDGFVRFLFGTYERQGMGDQGSLSFDLFVQACIGLKRMTDVFKRYDDDRDGFITLSFEDFLTEILRQR